MKTIDKLKNFDLNLLIVFSAIDEFRNITRAAKFLGITQPALSHSLGRLRVLLQDQLFVKSSKGMIPTPKAEQISAPIRQLLQTFESLVLSEHEFDPKNLRKIFKVHTTDLIECLLFPQLFQTLEEMAPHVQLHSRHCGFSLPRQELESGSCDLAIAGFFGKLPDGFYQQRLLTDKFQVAFRQNHPRLGGKEKITLEEYCAERHVIVAPGGSLDAKVDELLKAGNLRRKTVVGLNSFMSSAWIASRSDCLFTGLSRLIDQMAGVFPVQVLDLPFNVPNISIVQVWHEKNNQDLANKWFRQLIRDALQE